MGCMVHGRLGCLEGLPRLRLYPGQPRQRGISFSCGAQEAETGSGKKGGMA